MYMSQQVYKFSLSTINHMKKSYETQLIGTPQGAVFRAKTDHAVITAYRSGKVLFQGNSPETEIVKWGTTKQSNHTAKQSTKKVKANPFNPPSTLFTNSHIGSDESGTGDYFGPVTVAAVYVQDQDRKSTRLNSSHVAISYAVFCLKKKKFITDIYS